MALPLLLGGCGDTAPEHYYVLCEEQDYEGWVLIDVFKDDGGYILSCTYRSPDRSLSYTVSCSSTGCD